MTSPGPGDRARPSGRGPATRVDRLIEHLVGSPPDDAVARDLAGWLAGSARFRRFADANRDKIRKKLRGAANPDARVDVRAELRVAHLLLADRRLELAFEAYGSGRVGPDFTVTYRANTVFNVEVTRLHHASRGTDMGGVLLAKLRQLPPSRPNVLLLAVEGLDATTIDVAAVTQALRARADRRDEPFFARHGFDGTRAFYDRYLRLGAVVTWSERAAGPSRAAAWVNPSARIAVPGAGLRTCLTCLAAG